MCWSDRRERRLRDRDAEGGGDETGREEGYADESGMRRVVMAMARKRRRKRDVSRRKGWE